MLEHLPLDNPAARELRGPWGDDLRILHDIDSQLRNLLAQGFNIHRDRTKTAEYEPEYLPTPESLPAPDVPEVRQAQRADLQAVLSRPNPH